jgi:N-acetylglucosamine repressor
MRAKKAITKREKRHEILNFIREKRECSRSEIAEFIAIDKKSVSIIADELLSEKLILPTGFRDSHVGRRQELLALNGVHSNYIGIDLGANHIIGLRTDLSCRVLDRVLFEIRPGLPVDLILEQMKSIARTLVDSDNANSDLYGVGVCLPGFVNPVTGLSLMAENISGWHEINIKEILKDTVELPVYVEDCSRAMGLAERWLGKGGGTDDFLVLDLGYGIGMAIYQNGRLYTGCRYKSGELGHIVVEKNGPKCTCGKDGCLEVYASGRGIARIASEIIENHKSEILEELIHGDSKSVSAQDVAVAASMNDTVSLKVMRSAGEHIGFALSHAVNILNPQKIILGGGLMGAGKILTEGLSESLNSYTMKEIMADLIVEQSVLGLDASALGSALVAIEQNLIQ